MVIGLDIPTPTKSALAPLCFPFSSVRYCRCQGSCGDFNCVCLPSQCFQGMYAHTPPPLSLSHHDSKSNSSSLIPKTESAKPFGCSETDLSPQICLQPFALHRFSRPPDHCQTQDGLVIANLRDARTHLHRQTFVFHPEASKLSLDETSE